MGQIELTEEQREDENNVGMNYYREVFPAWNKKEVYRYMASQFERAIQYALDGKPNNILQHVVAATVDHILEWEEDAHNIRNVELKVSSALPIDECLGKLNT